MINSQFILSLPFSWTLLYFSALSFALGNLIYLIFCPKIIQEFNDFSEYKNFGYCMSHLNKHINHVFDNNKKQVKFLSEKLSELSDETESQDIDTNVTSVIETRANDRLYNIKNIFENDLFWLIYEKSNEMKKRYLIASCISFSTGFVLLSIIFLKNLCFVISNV
nr:Putative uncharacterized protein [Moritella viscosa]